MYIFSLFKGENLNELDVSLFDGEWKLADNRIVHTSHRVLGPAKSYFSNRQFRTQNRFYVRFDFVKPKGMQSKEETTIFEGHLFIREESGLILVATKGELVWTHEILDLMEERFGVRTTPLQPPAEQWISFLKEGVDLLSALVATRWGLEDLVKSDEFDWAQFESNPLVSASITLDHAGPFQVRVGSGLITVYDDGNENRVEYVSQLIENHLMNGEDYIESQSPCK